MPSMEKTTRHSPHFVIAKTATEPEAVIDRGEQVLERAHRVAHAIEELVRQVLDFATNSQPDTSRDERAQAKVPVDNRRRGG